MVIKVGCFVLYIYFWEWCIIFLTPQRQTSHWHVRHGLRFRATKHTLNPKMTAHVTPSLPPYIKRETQVLGFPERKEADRYTSLLSLESLSLYIYIQTQKHISDIYIYIGQGFSFFLGFQQNHRHEQRQRRLQFGWSQLFSPSRRRR